MRTDLPADLAELTSRPPVFRLLGVAEKVHGKHLNHVWKGLAGVPWLDEPAIPVFAKFLPRATQIDIELACGLASQALRLPVPKPALVIAELEDLQSPPASLKNGPIILFGSLFQPPDPFFARKSDDDAIATEFIWQKVCDDEVAPKGAAWDELVANPDRHAQNLLFDGSKWWLFDHNLALQPLTRLYQTLDKDSTQRTIIEHIAKVNQLLAQLTERRRADQSVLVEADRMLRQAKKLTLLAREVRKWKVDSRIDPIFTIAATIIDLIALRLQPLALYIEQRLDVPAGDSLWSN